MRLLLLILSVLAAILLIACDSGSTGPEEHAWPPDLSGTWVWAYSFKWGGPIHSPATEGHTAELHLTVSSENRHVGSYAYRVDGEVASQGTYAIGCEDAPGNDYINWEPAFGPYHHMTWLNFMLGDTIRLGDATVNGWDSRWARRAVIH